MTTTLISDTAMAAWQSFIRAKFLLSGTLDHELVQAHGLTLNDYGVLVHLRDADDQSMRMSDLACTMLLTRSGMTRLIDGLVRDGLVERKACASDARVSYAVITELGLERLAAARVTHHAGIQRMFADHYTTEELATLDELLGRIEPSSDAPDCSTAPCGE